MKFIDEAHIIARAGKGGDGAIAWRREKFVPRGGPAGGDGGNGGSVVFVADEQVHSLLDLRFRHHLFANNGERGRSKKQFGSKGQDAEVTVPVGTQVVDEDTQELLADFAEPGIRAVICKGGRGGWGNARFTSATRQAPDFAHNGTLGEERRLYISLKLLADVGLLGFPNAGKSTLLSVMSAARPKIAEYPFTTLVPQLGVVRAPSDGSYVMADIPGIVEGASCGVGLGFRFLKHLERVLVLCHLLEPLKEDGSPSSAKDLIRRYLAIREEIEKFAENLSVLPEVVVITKSDLIGVVDEKVLKEFQNYLKGIGKTSLAISAATQVGVERLNQVLWRMLAMS